MPGIFGIIELSRATDAVCLGLRWRLKKMGSASRLGRGRQDAPFGGAWGSSGAGNRGGEVWLAKR